jgi:hypothetical protein
MNATRRLERILSTLSALTLLLLLSGCHKAPVGIIQVVIQPGMDVSHPILYWETLDGRTAIYRIDSNTSHIECLKYDMRGVRDIRTSRTSTYILKDNSSGNLAVTRIESDTGKWSGVALNEELTGDDPAQWFVTGDDAVYVCGVDGDGKHRIVGIAFTREITGDPDRPDSDLTPKISWEETEWVKTDGPVGAFSLPDDNSIMAVELPLENGSEKSGLYFVDAAGGTPERVSDLPLEQLGGFSPDGKKLLATFDIEERVELYMIDAATRDHERITVSTRFYKVSDPVWHPGGRYFMYVLDFTSSFTIGDAPISGEQLYIYSLDSYNERRLTSLNGETVRADFARNGDFLLYSSIKGARTQRGGREIAIAGLKEGEGDVNLDEVEAWRLYYVPWNHEDFSTASEVMVRHSDARLMVSWAAIGDDRIAFAWGPGGEWDPSEMAE